MKYFLIIVLSFAFLSDSLEAQEPYKSYDKYKEMTDYEYPASDSLIKDAADKMNYRQKPVIYCYRDSAGYISIGDHDRVSVAVYDKNLNWTETQILYDGYFSYYKKRRKLKKEYEKGSAIIRKLYKKHGFDDNNEIMFTKITNPAGYWYETEAWKEDESVYKKLILDKDFKLVRIENSEN